MFDSAPENLYSHDPLFERTHSPLEHPAEGLEELGLAGPAEGLDRATADAFDPDSPRRWEQVEEDDDEDAEPATWGTYTCHDLDRRGHWDASDCCQECHDTMDTRDTGGSLVSLTHPKRGNVLVRACCALRTYLHDHLVRGHEDFLADLFGGDD